MVICEKEKIYLKKIRNNSFDHKRATCKTTKHRKTSRFSAAFDQFSSKTFVERLKTVMLVKSLTWTVCLSVRLKFCTTVYKVLYIRPWTTFLSHCLSKPTDFNERKSLLASVFVFSLLSDGGCGSSFRESTTWRLKTNRFIFYRW